MTDNPVRVDASHPQCSACGSTTVLIKDDVRRCWECGAVVEVPPGFAKPVEPTVP
jgi:uncharacterized Zn finger protein